MDTSLLQVQVVERKDLGLRMNAIPHSDGWELTVTHLHADPIPEDVLWRGRFPYEDPFSARVFATFQLTTQMDLLVEGRLDELFMHEAL